MKHKSTFVCKRSAAVSLLGAVALVMIIFAFVLCGNVAYAADRHDVTATRRSISAGVTETEYYTNNSENNDQTVVYAINVDLSQNTLIAGYKDYDTSKTWGMQTVREQAAAAEAKRGVNIVAAFNGDFYNMSSGEPSGVLVMNGEEVKVTSSALARNWFAITADNKAYIGSGALPENTVEAIGGGRILIKDGGIVLGVDDSYYMTKNPRTAVGIKADGNVVIVSANGRQAPYSSGYTYMELSQKMLELGCVVAINLDGGGSSTYLAQYAGTDELVLANSPSDGTERSVSSSLFVVSNAEETGIFGSVDISPNNEVYTPGTAVELSAIGADTAGFPMGIPSGAFWRLAEECSEMGSLEGRIEADGTAAATLHAAEGAVGTVVVELVYEGKVYGSTTIELQWPDSLTMTNTVYSLDFGERTDFGLTAYWNTRIVHLKEGDLIWEIGETGSAEYPSIGKMDGDIFVADEEATNVTATVTVKLGHNTAVFISAEVSVGQLPTVAWDFEDIKDPETGEVITEAEEYYTVAEDTSAYFRISFDPNNSGAKGSAQIVDATTGEVRVGEKALQLNYDFTNNAVAQVTAGVYFGPSTRYEVPGHPTGLGVWVYAPEGTPNFWLRSYLFGEDENGNPTEGNVGWGGDKGAYVVDFTSSTTELQPGWHYYEADLTNFTNLPYTWILTNQTFRIMQLTGNGAPVAGYLYLDNFQFVYGANTDDLYAPEIQSVQIGNSGGAAVEDGMVVSDDPFSIYASYNEFMGLSDEELEEIEDEADREAYEKAPMYATGVNTADVHVYVDGNEVELALVTETELFTKDIRLPNGKHKITIEVSDNFQNRRTVSYVIEVSNESGYASAGLQGVGKESYLGSDYLLDLVADLPASVQEATFEVRLATGFSLEAGDAVSGFEVTRCGLTHVNNNVYTVTIRRTAGEFAEGSAVIAKFKIHCDPSLPEGSVLSYSIDMSSVVYAEGVQEDVLNSFYTEAEIEVLPYYIIEADTMVVGSEGGYIYVTDAAGNPAAGVTVTVDGVQLDKVTDEEGKVYTDLFVAEKCSKTVAAYSEDGYSYGLTVYGVLPGGMTDEEGAPSAAPAFVRSVATVDGNTEQRIFWLANPLAANASAQVRYATAEEYEAKGEGAFRTVNGTNQLLEFTGTYAVYVNHVLLEGLAENTQYVYRAGDGTTWSEIKHFSTAKNGAATDFIVMGDTQAENSEIFEAYGNAIVNSGVDYDFAIQTGDFVDQGSNYELWAAILDVFSEYFSDIDFVQTFGNHEYSGSALYPMAMTFSPSEKYYSVTYGNVYIAVINCYTESDMREAAAWIEADAVKSDAVWKVLSLHRPPYYTNVIGGSENSHAIIPALADAAGFDVVFSGHDHSYARTQPMTGGAVDEENGTVYFIVGAAEEGGKYEITDDPAFNFAKVSGDFNALYFSVHATDTEMQITVYNLTDDGVTFEVFDSYTIRNDCAGLGHDFSYIGGRLVCDRCHYAALPSEIGFSGLVQDEEGHNWYFSGGSPWAGWLQLGEEQYYFLEDGSAANGEVVLQADYESNAHGDISFTFENGLLTGGHTGWYGPKYYVEGQYITGWIELEDGYYYLATGNDALRNPGVETGDKLTGYCSVYTPTEPYFTIYYIHFDEDGRYVRGDFHLRGDGQNYAITYVTPIGNSDRTVWILYYCSEWVPVNGDLFYVDGNCNLVTGLYEIDGVLYNFSDAEGKPDVTGRGKCLGTYSGWLDDRYYVDGVMQQGWSVIDGDYYYFATENDDGMELGKKFTGRRAVYTPTQPYATYYYINFAEDGKYVSGDWHLRSDGVSYAYTYVEKPAEGDVWVRYKTGWFEVNGKSYYGTDGGNIAVGNVEIDGVMYSFGSAEGSPADTDRGASNGKLTGWIADKHYSEGKVQTGWFEVNGKRYYGTDDGDIAVGDYQINGVMYAFDGSAGSPADTNRGALVGRYYTVRFLSDGAVVRTESVLSGKTVEAFNYVKEGNSIKSFVLVAWMNGEQQYSFDSAVEQDLDLVAHFEVSYSDKYVALKDALDALPAVQQLGLSGQYAALTAVYNAREAMSEAELSDARAEGLDLTLYDTMLEAYNKAAASAEDDMNSALEAAMTFIGTVAALAAVAVAVVKFACGR